MMTGKQNLVIAGSNKCGTTSVFRYLGAHPSVCLSRTKEAAFFYTNKGLETDELRRSYQELFTAPDEQATLFVEATPTYLHGGIKVAEHIHRILPNASIMFLLREPADRLASFYRSKFEKSDSALGQTDFRSFVSVALQASDSGGARPGTREGAFLQEFTMARYADFLPDYLDVFGKDGVGVFFFEDMIADPRKFMSAVCNFVDLSPDCYQDFAFTVENKTRYHRSTKLRKLATIFNERFEASLNRLPAARKTMRQIYNLANAKPSDTISLDSEAYEDVVVYYRDPNDQLRQLLLANYPDIELPTWLS